MQSITPTSAVVRWRTDTPSDSRVRYGAAPGKLVRQVDHHLLKTEHQILLTDLSPGSKHFYAVGARNFGPEVSDPSQHFTTAPHPSRPRPVRIWGVGDFGTGDVWQAAVRDAFYTFTGSRDPDVWITFGDNAYVFGSDTDFQNGFFNPYAPLLKRVPVWPSLGNHDTATTKTFHENYPYFSVFTLPTNGEAGGAPSGTERYYSFDHGDIHFVCLDTQLAPLTANGAMATWLQADLAATDKKWLIAYCHHPPYSRGSHSSDTEAEMVQLRQNFLPLLEAAGVDLVLAGHSHNYERSRLINGHYGIASTLEPSMVLNSGLGRPGQGGAYTKPAARTPNAGTVYAVVGNSGALWGGGTLDHPVMVVNHGANVLGSLVLDVDGDRLDATYVRHDGQIGDSFTIHRGNAAPQALPLALQTPHDTAVAIAFPGSDLNGGSLTYSVSRQPGHGKLIGFDPAAGTATYVPVRGFHGTDRFDYQLTDSAGAVASATAEVTVLAAPDLDTDGLPDAWETATGQGDPAGDPDGDGFTNRQEWMAATLPVNGASFPKVDAVQSSPGGNLLQWAAVGGVRYRVSYSDAGFTFVPLVRAADQELAALANGASGAGEFFDDFTQTGVPPGGGPRFYRLTVVDPVVNALPTLTLAVQPGTDGPTGRSAMLNATGFDADQDPLKVAWYGRPLQPPPGPDFTVVAMPDTQYYTDGTGGGQPDTFHAQTDWVIRNRMARNIAFVVQLGDCTNRGDHSPINPDGKPMEWEIASKALYRFEDPSRTQLFEGIPYGVAVGNHDQIPSEDPDGTTFYYNRYFGVNHFSPKTYYGGNYGIDNDNHYQLFEAGGLKFIVVTTEYDNNANPAVLDWADHLLKTHADRRAIVCSHRLLREDGVLQAQGVATYEALKDNPNLFLMLCAHHDGESRIFRTFEGRTVIIMMANYQQRPNGGNGWMRLLRFSPANNRIYAETYSPKLGQYETDSNSQFSDPYPMQVPQPAFTLLGTQVLPPGGAAAALPWTSLKPGTTYECYATVDDGVATATTPVQSFQTAAGSLPVIAGMVVPVAYNTPTPVVLQGNSPGGGTLRYAIEIDPLHGTVSQFDYTTGQFIYTPALGFSGSDSLTYRVGNDAGSSAPAVATFQVAAPVDQNNDGMADAWEALFGVTGGTGDDDRDGRSNLEEHDAGTDPTSYVSSLKVTSWGLAPFLQHSTRKRYTLKWSAVAGVQYRVQYCDGGTGMQFVDVVRPTSREIAGGAPGTATVQEFTDDFYYTGGPPATGQRYFRVKVIR